MPTRYSGNEINAVRKDPEKTDLSFALVFPDLYEIGTSHFGIQILYSILNARDEIAAERFFAPAPDMEAILRDRGIPCLSMESRRDLKDFDIIGVSLLYELNFTNILTMMSLSGIEFHAENRRNVFPLVIGGGPCAFNPEPLADFFDAFVIGDGEQAVIEISEKVIEFKKHGDGSKRTLLRLLSEIEGVYVPCFFNAELSEAAGTGYRLVPVFDDYTRVRRAFLPELTRHTFPYSPIVPFAKPVHDRLRLEIARGCTRGCRFCQAGMIYRPVRERSLPDLIEIAEKSLQTTGYSDISLLSLSTGDYSSLASLMSCLLELGRGHCNAVSLPSIRAEKLTPELMNIIRRVRKTGFTIAPEAGSQRLRDIINKNLTEQSISAAVENALKLGWKTIKLYFMMGLPFETDDDIEAICSLATRLASAHAKGKKTINASVACFIPKAHTPFQWCSQISLGETKRKLQYLKDNLRHRKVNLKWQSPEMSLVEGVWARGDRKLSGLLVAAFKNGCRLDGWADQFDFNLWQKSFEESGIDPETYMKGSEDPGVPLAWDHIDSGVSCEFLREEYEKAKQGAQTPDCRENGCTGCGVCDFRTIKPVLHKSVPREQNNADSATVSLKPAQEKIFKKFEIRFSKLGPARFFGHLELATIFQRAIRRAKLNARYSQGFNPQMKLSFENALPVGMESEEEICCIELEGMVSPEIVMNRLNNTLPSGLDVTGCSLFTKSDRRDNDISRYIITMPDAIPEKHIIAKFLSLDSFVVEDFSKKGKIRRTDLRRAVEKISVLDLQTIEMVLKKYNGRTIRPARILTQCLNMNEKAVMQALIRKVKQG
jgi:radical SAM family uncharacterized protein/radical SAM-linked protein